MIDNLVNFNDVLSNADRVEVSDWCIEAYFNETKEVVKLLKPLSELCELKFYNQSDEKEVDLEAISEPFYLELESPEIKVVSDYYAIGNRLINNHEDPIKSLQKNVYFLKSSKTFLTQKNPEFSKLSFLAKLTVFLCEVADHVDEKEYIFWADGKALIINSISSEEFDNLTVDIESLNKLVEQVKMAEHHVERESIFKVALKKSIGDSSQESMFLPELISKLESIKRLWSEGYFAYLHDLDFDEIRDKILEKINATHDAIGQVLSSAQIRILAVPLAVIVGASQFNKIEDAGFALAAFFGLFLLVVAGYLLFSNAKDDIEAVESKFNHWTSNMNDSKLIEEFDQDIEKVRKRIQKQKDNVSTLSCLNILFSIVILIVAFRSVTHFLF